MKFWGWQMGRKLTVTLAIALLMFVLAPMARADIITTTTGELVIPDGSQVTSVFIGPVDGVCFFAVGVDFSFKGGMGETAGCTADAGYEIINFTVPVGNLTVDVAAGAEVMTLFADDGEGFACTSADPFSPNPCPGPFLDDLTFKGPVSSLDLQNFMGILRESNR
jgi:hypothetical protein